MDHANHVISDVHTACNPGVDLCRNSDRRVGAPRWLWYERWLSGQFQRQQRHSARPISRQSIRRPTTRLWRDDSALHGWYRGHGVGCGTAHRQHGHHEFQRPVCNHRYLFLYLGHSGLHRSHRRRLRFRNKPGPVADGRARHLRSGLPHAAAGRDRRSSTSTNSPRSLLSTRSLPT